MRSVYLLVVLLVGCLAQTPQPCTSPSQMTGGFSVATQTEKLTADVAYSYDADGQRIFLRDTGSYKNESFSFSMLLLFKQSLFYKINYRDRTCYKKRLDSRFHPLAIPKNASLLGEVVVGSSSVPGEGILVDTWVGEMHLPKGTAKYITTVTQMDCIPVSTYFHMDWTGWVINSFYNNVIGLVDPQLFIPPDFCLHAEVDMEPGEEPAPFFTLF